MVGLASHTPDNMGATAPKGLDFDYTPETPSEVEADACDAIEEEGNTATHIEFIDSYKGTVVSKVVGTIEPLIIEPETTV